MSERSKMNTSWWYALVGGFACVGVAVLLMDHWELFVICVSVGIGIALWMIKDLGTARIKREAQVKADAEIAKAAHDEMKAEIAELKKQIESLKSGGSEN
ncbi:MAG: hypothetical protein GY758_05000 [Fuerstiella sp.]|nr:hypothetical protein [Fuerstiella sp.]MCP4509604.1 hypothetical protein [Fuerstiella sp.]